MRWFSQKSERAQKDEKVREDVARSQEEVSKAAKALQQALLAGLLDTQKDGKDG